MKNEPRERVAERNSSEGRQVLECASPLALSIGARMIQERQRAAALQDAGAAYPATCCFPQSRWLVTRSAILLLLATTLVHGTATTNNLTSLLQQGLFEEEANRNLEAAIASYESLATQFDKDRQIAATAVFRLGECYRKLGKTNEAVIQYERIVRDFADQQTLVMLSRQNLTGLSAATGSVDGAASDYTIRAGDTLASVAMSWRSAGTDVTQQEILDANPGLDPKRLRIGQRIKIPQKGRAAPNGASSAEVALLKAQLEQFTSLSPEEARIYVQQNFPNPVLTKLMQDLSEAEQHITRLSPDFSAEHPAVVNAREVVKTIRDQIDQQVKGVVTGLKTRLASAEASGSAGPPTRGDSGNELASTTGDEQQEILRIQAMIRNSPDLINAAPPGSNGFTPLHTAAKAGQLTVARFLLDNGAKVESRTTRGDTPLTLAAAAGHKAMVELLLGRGADVNDLGGTGLAALHQAALQGFEGVAEVLIANKAEVDTRTEPERLTPLNFAARDGHTGLVELLLHSGADVNAADRSGSTPLMAAAVNGHLPSVQALLKAKAAPNVLNESGRTALSLAVGNPHTPCIEALLKAKADPNAGTTDLPLSIACNLGGTNIALMLLQAGADPNREAFFGTAVDFYGRQISPKAAKLTPLQIAVAKNRADLAKLFFQFKADPKAVRPQSSVPLVWETFPNADLLKAFLDAGADPNAAGDWRGQGSSVLTMAASVGNAAGVEALLAAGARVNPPPDAPVTPLELAIQYKGDEETIRLLLDAGADVNRRNRAGLTPLLSAVNDKKTSLAALLLAHGADPNLTKLDTGDTPLHWAVAYQNRGLVELLLTNKANVNLRNRDGKTPLDLASGRIQNPSAPGLPLPLRPIPIPAPPVPYGGPGVPLPPLGSTENQASSPEVLADLLRKHGALDEVPDFNSIIVRRPSNNYSAVAFRRGTNEWNSFSLLEVLACQYKLIQTSPQGIWERKETFLSRFWDPNPCRFPDLRRIVIRRPIGNDWTTLQVDVATPLNNGDCSFNQRLKWGDVVEILEADHPVNEPWSGLNRPELDALLKCLSRRVQLSIKGTRTNLELGPTYEILGGGMPDPAGGLDPRLWVTPASFAVRSALENSKLIRASSDLSRVKVMRLTGKRQQWVLDCSGDKAPDLWLQDGDVIEVPEK